MAPIDPELLAPPHIIARRLLAWPLYQAAKSLIFLVVWFGRGLEDAKRTWSWMD
jgi:hypothetical protein